MKIEFSGVSFSGLYVRTLKLSIIRDLKLMLTKYFEKKTKKKPKKKKKRKPSFYTEGKCDAIFFCKKYSRFLFHGYSFCKKPVGLDIVSTFFQSISLLSFFYFLTVLLLTEFLSMEIRVNKSAQKDAFRIVNYHKIFFDNKP